MITNTSKHVCVQYKNLFVKEELEFILKLWNKLHELWPHYYHKVMLTYFVYYNGLRCTPHSDYPSKVSSFKCFFLWIYWRTIKLPLLPIQVLSLDPSAAGSSEMLVTTYQFKYCPMLEVLVLQSFSLCGFCQIVCNPVNGNTAVGDGKLPVERWKDLL